jgi:hypothetical protein
LIGGGVDVGGQFGDFLTQAFQVFEVLGIGKVS